jgi:hypothetical protein
LTQAIRCLSLRPLRRLRRLRRRSSSIGSSRQPGDSSCDTCEKCGNGHQKYGSVEKICAKGDENLYQFIVVKSFYVGKSYHGSKN